MGCLADTALMILSWEPVVGNGDFRLSDSPAQRATTTCAFARATKKGVAPARFL